MSENEKKVNDIGIFVIDRETYRGLDTLVRALFEDQHNLGRELQDYIRAQGNFEHVENLLKIISETMHKNNWCEDPECEYFNKSDKK